MGHAQGAVDPAEAQGEAVAEDGLPSDSTGQGSPSLVERVVGPYRAVMKFLGRRALARVTLAVPRTLRFMVATAIKGDASDAAPAPRLSLGLVAGVAMASRASSMAT